MTKEETKTQECCQSKKWKGSTGAGGGMVWCLGFIGALVYYIQQATSFSTGLMGFLKALVWPAMVVYHMLGFLKM